MRIGRSLLLFSALSLGSAFAQTAQELSTQANAAYDQKHYTESVALYEKFLLKADPEDLANAQYNAACSYALIPDKDSALRLFAGAIENGYLDADHMKVDTDLASLHGESRWQALLARAASLKQQEAARWNTKALNTPYADNISDAEKLAGLSKLWAEARYNFANFWHVPTLDWDAAYLAAIPRVMATRSTLDYYHEVQRFIALLQDGHTNVYFPDSYYQNVTGLPISTRLVDGRVLVTDVRRDSLRASGVVPGVEVVAIDGLTTKQYGEQKLAPFESASSPQDRDLRTYTYDLNKGPVGSTTVYKFRDVKGREWSETFTREKPRPVTASAPVTPSDGPSSFRMKTLPGGILHIRLRSFEDNSAAEEFEKHFDEIQKAPAIVLDVRDNGGGNGGVGFRILAMLVDKPFLTSRWSTRTYVPVWRPWGNLQRDAVHPASQVQPNAKLHYSGKVALLTGPATFSAAEDFAVAYVNSQRGPRHRRAHRRQHRPASPLTASGRRLSPHLHEA